MTLLASGEVGFMVSTGARSVIRATLGRLGVAIHEHARVVAMEKDGVVLSSGDVLTSDVTAWCGGLAPTTLARDTGLDSDARGRAIVDGHLRSTSHDFVRVIGDAARVEVLGHGEPLRMACATAIPQGAFCADDMAADLHGKARRAFSFAYLIQCISLGRTAGIVQHVDPWDAPRSLFARGRAAAWGKELINRYAFGSVRLERHGIGYSWPKAPRLAAARTDPMLATRAP